MRLYLDAMVWIYALESHEQFGPRAQALLHNITRERHTIVTSHYLLAEVLVLPVRKNDVFMIASYRRALLSNPDAQLTTFGTVAAMTFAHLRATQRVKPPDAIHLALAATANVDAFTTTDTRLHSVTVPGIGRMADLSTTLP